MGGGGWGLRDEICFLKSSLKTQCNNAGIRRTGSVVLMLEESLELRLTKFKKLLMLEWNTLEKIHWSKLRCFLGREPTKYTTMTKNLYFTNIQRNYLNLMESKLSRYFVCFVYSL